MRARPCSSADSNAPSIECPDIDPKQEMTWRTYAVALSALQRSSDCIACYSLQRLQGVLPLNPQTFPAVGPDLAFNTASSFATNTNWQSYGGETTLSYLVANGRARRAELRFGRRRHGGPRRADPRTGPPLDGDDRQLLVRSDPLDALHPACRSRSSSPLLLVSQGVVQNFRIVSRPSSLVQPTRRTARISRSPNRRLPMGPAASQIAIKQLGTNGGGFFNVQLGPPVRESDAALQLPRNARDPR